MTHPALSKRLKAFIAKRSRKGNSCAECNTVFTVTRGDGKKVAIFPNCAGGVSVYVLCGTCGIRYEQIGKAAIPNIWKDSRVASLMSPYGPKTSASAYIH